MLNLFDPFGGKELEGGEESAFTRSPDFVDIAMSKTKEMLLREIGGRNNKGIYIGDGEISEKCIKYRVFLSASLVAIFFIISNFVAYNNPNGQFLLWGLSSAIVGFIYSIVRLRKIRKKGNIKLESS